MKTQLSLILIFICLLLLSCQTEDTQETDNSKDFPFEAIVKWPNMDCGLYEIEITKGLDELKDILGTIGTQDTYIANNLADDLQEMDLEISFDARKNENHEIRPCTAMGPSYPWLYITEAEKN